MNAKELETIAMFNNFDNLPRRGLMVEVTILIKVLVLRIFAPSRLAEFVQRERVKAGIY